MKRGYLLPEGCKDLIDALKLQERENTAKKASALPPLSNEPKDEFQAEFERLAKLDQQWRDHFGSRSY